MKPREPREKTLIRARLRSDSGWSDACILNVSSRGLLAQTAQPPARGDYIEIHRGSYCIVARVIWTSRHRFGLRSQEALVIGRLLGEPGPANAPTKLRALRNDRRATPRTSAEEAERSRQRARAFEFVSAVLAGLAAAIAGFGVVSQMLGAPLRAIGAALPPL